MNKIQKAIEYFENAVRESDEIIDDCSEDLKAELIEQKKHFVVALEVMQARDRGEYHAEEEQECPAHQEDT